MPSLLKGLAVVCALSLVTFMSSAQEKKLLTYDQIFRNGEPRLLQPLPMITGWADDTHYLAMRGRGGAVMMVDAVSGAEQPHHDLSAFKTIADSTIQLNNPDSRTEDFSVDVYEKDGDLYLLDTRVRAFKRLTTTEVEEKNPTVSPDGKFVAFTRNNDLYVIDCATGQETRLTADGTDAVYNGRASWVYYEEIFGRPCQYRAFWWSPDSRRIAFYRFDDSRVPLFPLYKADGQHGSLEYERYPKAGDPNPEVRVGCVAVNGGPVTWADFDPKADQYFGTPFWTPSGDRLVVQWMNRGQDNLKLFAVDPATGRKNEIYDEKQLAWVDWFDDVKFLKDGREMLLLSDKDGWLHIYRYSIDGTLIKQLTSGEWAVNKIEAVDEKSGALFFSARKENSTRLDLYRIQLDGTDLRRLTPGAFNNMVSVSPNGSYFTTSCSNVSTPTRLVLYDGKGKLLKEIGNSKLPVLDEFNVAKTELFRITTPDGFALPVTWTLPVPFDPHKKYPVIISIYGGPGFAGVADHWPGLSSQWLAQEGVIQITADHRGSGHFGKKGVAMMHRNLGKWEMNDYIEVVKWLRTKSFVDSTKICITGGSYGGYVTCMALTAGADYFTHGVADFSVTDWLLYDSHYTERYMDAPSENPEGYKNGSVMTYAGKYKGMLRIAHGTMDDNVHMQNSIQLVSALEDLGKHFEFMMYPNGRHGWGGPKAGHLMNETMRFYYQYLLEKPFPEALFAQPRMGGPRM